MCKTYRWTCNACGRLQSRGQRCSTKLATSSSNVDDINCPINIQIDGPPPQSEHSGIRCAYCHTPSYIAANVSQPRNESQTVNPASIANPEWEARQPIMSASSWNTNNSSPRVGLQHHAASTGYQTPSSAMAATARNYVNMPTTPRAATQHQNYSSHLGHAHAIYPHQHHGRNLTPVSLPLFSQQHHHARFTSPPSSKMPIDPQILPPHTHYQHPNSRSYPHGAASSPPFMPPAPPPTPTQHHVAPSHARPLQHQGPHAAAPSAATTGGGTAASASAPRSHLRSPTDMLASMTATRTALFVQAEAQRATVVERGQSQGVDVPADSGEAQAAWYAMWEGCGVPRATVSAAAAVAKGDGEGKGGDNGQDGASGEREE